MKSTPGAWVLMLLIPAFCIGVLAGCGKKGPPLPPLPPRQSPAKKQDKGAMLKGSAALGEVAVLDRGLKRGAGRKPLSLTQKKRS